MWKWISCRNDVMNNVDCVIKRDVYSQKMQSCSKNILGVSFLDGKFDKIKKFKGEMKFYIQNHLHKPMFKNHFEGELTLNVVTKF